jgi:hypothetical protein
MCSFWLKKLGLYYQYDQLVARSLWHAWPAGDTIVGVQPVVGTASRGRSHRVVASWDTTGLRLYPTTPPLSLNSVYGEALKQSNHSPSVTRRLGREKIFPSLIGEL